MGTRADFYILRGDKLSVADWCGSQGWDGYPYKEPHDTGGVPLTVLRATTDAEFILALAAHAKETDSFTKLGEHGWPWLWADSTGTDFAYVFSVQERSVSTYIFGRLNGEGPVANIFPDMTSIQEVTMGLRSGLIVLQGGKEVELP